MLPEWLRSKKIKDDIMSAILPDEDLEELPTGFSIVGHVGKETLRFCPQFSGS